MSSRSSYMSSFLSFLKYMLSSLATSILDKCWIIGVSTGIYTLKSLKMLLIVLSPVTGEILIKCAICMRDLVRNMRNFP